MQELEDSFGIQRFCHHMIQSHISQHESALLQLLANLLHLAKEIVLEDSLLAALLRDVVEKGAQPSEQHQTDWHRSIPQPRS